MDAFGLVTEQIDLADLLLVLEEVDLGQVEQQDDAIFIRHNESSMHIFCPDAAISPLDYENKQVQQFSKMCSEKYNSGVLRAIEFEFNGDYAVQLFKIVIKQMRARHDIWLDDHSLGFL